MVWTKSLSLLRLAGHGMTGPLPTWVPDFRELPATTHLSLRSNASLNSPALIHQSIRGQIHVHALMIDTVLKLGSRVFGDSLQPSKSRMAPVLDARELLLGWQSLAFG